MLMTPAFNDAISNHIKYKIANDFTFIRENNDEEIENCCNYIISEVRKSECNGFADEDIFTMAEFFFNNKDITAVPKINYRVVINKVIPLTEEEKIELKEQAKIEVLNDYKSKMTNVSKPIKKDSETLQQSLF
jgi:hypothetical protein